MASFALHELGNTYAHPTDRYVVSLIVGYQDDEAASPHHAAAAALALTQDAGAHDTHWYVYDRQTQTATEFGHLDVQIQARKSLKDAVFMNATRWRWYTQLKATSLPVEGGSGGHTKKQRTEHHLPKEHDYDALCVGPSTPDRWTALPAYVQIWTAKGRGNRQCCRTDGYGFPIRYRSRRKMHFGFQTGDLVVARVPHGKYAGITNRSLPVATT